MGHRKRSGSRSSSSSSSSSSSGKSSSGKHNDCKHSQHRGDHSGMAGSSHLAPSGTPPAYTQYPPSGFRIPLTTGQPFPSLQSAGNPCAYDLNGTSPIYFGSALMSNSVHPCKIAPDLAPPCRVAYGGREFEHHGRYDLLPFDTQSMELVPTSNGQIPTGRRPIEGGYEENGDKLYHAVAYIDRVLVPGKTGPHLGGANVPFGGREHIIRQNYQILCWRG